MLELQLSNCNSLFELFAVFNFIYVSSKNIFGSMVRKDVFINPLENLNSELVKLKENIEQTLKDLTETNIPDTESNLLLDRRDYVKFFERKQKHILALENYIDESIISSFISQRFPSYCIYSGLYCIFMLLLGLNNNTKEVAFFLFAVNIYTILYIIWGLLVYSISKMRSVTVFFVMFLVALIYELSNHFIDFGFTIESKEIRWWNIVVTLAFCFGHFVLYFFWSIYNLIFIQFDQRNTLRKEQTEIDLEQIHITDFLNRVKSLENANVTFTFNNGNP